MTDQPSIWATRYGCMLCGLAARSTTTSGIRAADGLATGAGPAMVVPGLGAAAAVGAGAAGAVVGAGAAGLGASVGFAAAAGAVVGAGAAGLAASVGFAAGAAVGAAGAAGEHAARNIDAATARPMPRSAHVRLGATERT